MTTRRSTLPSFVENHALVTAGSDRHRPDRASPWSASLTLGWRAMLKLKHVPTQLIDATMFPVLMTLMFAYVFGGALAGSVGDYLQVLMPGIVVLSVAMITQTTALALNTDIATGIFDRFRTLPFWRPAVLVGALLGDTVRYALAALVVLGLGLLLGFRPAAGPGGVALSLVLVLLFAFSLSWIWTALGLWLEDPKSVSMVASLTSFPLLFISNVFADPATMPTFLQGIVRVNPVSLTATAVRGTMHGNATGAELSAMLLACVVLVGLFAPLTMHLYNRRNAG